MLLLGLSIGVRSGHAHQGSGSFLSLEIQPATVTGQWDIPVRDVEAHLGLLLNGDKSEALPQAEWEKAVAKYAFAHLVVRLDETTSVPQLTEQVLVERLDGYYSVIRFVLPSAQEPSAVEVNYHAFFERDRSHFALFRLYHGDKLYTCVFNNNGQSQRFELRAPTGWRQFLGFCVAGVWHIWTGYDHILFLLALLLPSVLQATGGEWQPACGFRPALLSVVKVVTAFTVAHSVTLSLAVLGWVHLPSRWVESAIAASVAIAALNNLIPLVQRRAWLIAFGFGLIHGFGFASVLLEGGFDAGARAKALVGFNLGVEAGQLVVVGLFLPVAFWLRASWVYRRLTLQLGSATIILVAGVWMTERLCGTKWLPF